jgi:hypothetical protein
MKVLGGSLKDGEISELGGKARKIGKNPFISLVAKKGKPGSSMEDMVDSGKLDPFLPYAMRPGQPNYDNADAAEYIREKLRTGEFYTDDIRQEIEDIQRGIWDIEAEIQQELSLEDINREIQYAVDEQRAIDQEAAQAPTEGAPEALESGARGEEEFLKAQNQRFHSTKLRHSVSTKLKAQMEPSVLKELCSLKSPFQSLNSEIKSYIDLL